MSFNTEIIDKVKVGFQKKCICILIDGYKAMLEQNEYSVNWEEEDITAQLIYFSEKSNFCFKWKINIFPERKLYNKDIIFGNKSAKQARRIDMQMISWKNKEKENYYFEAKNLCEKDWIKNDGSNVSSSQQLNRYINTGIEHSFTNYYPQDGCLCGYIMQGNLGNIISKLNFRLEKKSYNQLLLNNKPINNYNQIYTIKKDNYSLLNIFFDFNK